MFLHLSGSVGVSLALVVPSVLGVLYLLLWQSYVLRFQKKVLCSQVSEKKSYVFRFQTQQESFWGLTLLAIPN